ncbi:hypothetical protein [Allocoleopsis franciscana]|uniref:Uncharacterized protein n=1 Tax=Allocoleopsis franciscana PCC 7113 TaxID=1173027 RepID=K9WRF9_9CYAN|nr:hypothetical protein [Allocoleopsis franciscana]AFZ22369.1 hypothetical protein Mic7113_6812 [Allocoleopsis franciscana PCC 7113]
MAKARLSRDYTQDVIDAKQRFDDVLEHIEEPPDGQIPLGDWGIYTSPNLQSNEPVSPFDCDQYPDSPYCGGNPWTKTPVGLEPEWGMDECGVWVELNPVLGFTKLPPVSIGWRRPGECREEEKPPEPEPEPEDESRPVSPLKFPDTIDPNLDVFIVLVRAYKYYFLYTQGDPDNYGRIPPPTSNLLISNHDLADSLYPAPALTESYFPSRTTGLYTQVAGIGRAKIKETTLIVEKGYQPDPNSTASIPPLVPTETIRNITRECTGWITSDQSPPQIPNVKRYASRPLTGNYLITNCSEPGFINLSASVVIFGKINQIKRDWENYVGDVNFRFQKGVNGAVNNGFVIDKEEWKIAYVSQPNSKNFPPPPNQKKKKKCCMQCCSNNSQSNKQNQDNAEILRLLRKIDKNIGGFPFKAEIFDNDSEKVGIQKKNISVGSLAHANALAIGELQRTLKAIGIDHFPIYSPSSVIQDESNGLLGDLGDLKNKLFKQKIDSLAEFLVWRAKNDNEIFGQWQEVIEIQDSDPNVKGNQPKRVVLPNMAKTLREIILLLSVLIKSQGFSMDALLKMYIDVANTKVSVAAVEAIIRDVQDYLDYPTNTKTIDVPLGISIPKDNDPTDDKEDVERFLRSSTVKAMFDDWTGEGSIHDMLLTLLDAASRQIQKPHT